MPATVAAKSRAGFEILRSSLDQEFASRVPILREVADHVCPWRPQFFTTDSNRGDRRSTKIIDGTAAKAAETFASFMMGGNTSPTSPWLRMTTSRPLDAENYGAKEYLDDVTDQFLEVCAKSNFYDSKYEVYYDGGNFATAVELIEEDFETVFHSTVLPVGSYRLGLGKKNQPEVLFREFRMTVRELVMEFGMEYGEEEINWERFSPEVRRHYDQKQMEIYLDVCHVVMPNPDHDPDMMDSKYKRFTSCYYEKGKSSANSAYEPGERYLREKGYDRCPFFVFYFQRSAGDAYGTNCPGFMSLGDNKELQHLWKRHAQAVDKQVGPPMQAPAQAQNIRWSTLPNDTAYIDYGMNGQKIEPIYQVQPNTGDIKEMIQDLRFQIKSAYFVDIMLSLIDPAVDRKDMTAREVDERHDEKYMRVGSILEKINPVLKGEVSLILGFMMNQGLIEEPPEELAGEEIKLEFISVMAASQKLIRLGGVERFTQFVLSISEVAPQAWDKVNIDNLLDVYAEGVSLQSKCMATDEQAMKVRQARSEAQAQQAQAEAAPGLAKAAKDMSEIDPNADSALTRIAEQVGASQ